MSCSVCGEQGHSMTKCPTLIAPLQPGFFTGGPSGGGEEDSAEKIGAACDGRHLHVLQLLQPLQLQLLHQPPHQLEPFYLAQKLQLPLLLPV